MSLPAGWHAEKPAPIASNELFLVDDGGAYDVIFREDGTVDVYGHRSKVRYSSTQTRLVITGKRRVHPGGRWGHRAVLHLDTGEGISELRGIVRR
jgi:lipopolysaccharide export system protein LptA